MTFDHFHDSRDLGNGKVVFQYAVQNLVPGLLLLYQCHILHGVTFSLTS